MTQPTARELHATRIDLAQEPDVAFGLLQVKPALREIAGSGWTRTLEPRVMQVLVALARANGEVVSRDDLISACWEGRAVSEDAIYRCIAQLRKLLEEKDAPCEVETVARVGYRLATVPGQPQRDLSPPRPRGALPASASDLAIINDLIGDIYECAIDPTQWDDALAHLVSALSPADWDVAGLVWEQLSPPTGKFVGSTGFSAVSRDVYCQAFAGRTPWARPLAALPLGQVVDTDEVVPRSELTESHFYNSFLKTWGMELAVVVALDREGPQNLGLAMPGPPGRDLGGLKRGLRMLAPHLQRAIRISKSLGEANLRAAAGAAAVDRAPVAVVTLTSDLAVVTANAKALDTAGKGQFEIAAGRFAFRDAAAQRQLAELAAAPAPATATIRIPDPGHGEMVVLAARMQTQTARTLAGDMEGAGIVLTIGIGDRAPLIEINRLGHWFGLTPTEARLTVALAQGDTLHDYSQRRCVTMNALKFQLKNIYHKTDTASLTDLVDRVRGML